MIVSGKPSTGRPKIGSHRKGRDSAIYIRISSSDLKKLERLAAFYGITKTDYIIMSIENGYEKVRKEINDQRKKD